MNRRLSLRDSATRFGCRRRGLTIHVSMCVILHIGDHNCDESGNRSQLVGRGSKSGGHRTKREIVTAALEESTKKFYARLFSSHTKLLIK